MIQNDNFRQDAVHTIINIMFNIDKFFDVCKLNKIIPDWYTHPKYRIYNALHCVDYKHMSPDFKAELQKKITDILMKQLNNYD